NNQRDGFMRQTINKGKTNYFPNSRGKGCPMMAPESAGAFIHHMQKVDGTKIRNRSESFKDHYSQARLFWNSMADFEKEHIRKAFYFELGKVEELNIRERMVEQLAHIDLDLAGDVAMQIGVDFSGSIADR